MSKKLPDVVRGLDKYLVLQGFKDCPEEVTSVLDGKDFYISKQEFCLAMELCTELGRRAAREWWNDLVGWNIITDVRTDDGMNKGLLRSTKLDNLLKTFYGGADDQKPEEGL